MNVIIQFDKRDRKMVGQSDYEIELQNMILFNKFLPSNGVLTLKQNFTYTCT